MARAHNNPLLKGVTGRLGDSILVKQYSYGTVITAMPIMGRKKRSPVQGIRRDNFSEAVKYAKSILRNYEKKMAYKKTLPPGKSVYHAAIQEYLKMKKDEELASLRRNDSAAAVVWKGRPGEY